MPRGQRYRAREGMRGAGPWATFGCPPTRTRMPSRCRCVARALAAALSLVDGGLAGLPFLTADARLAEAAEIEGLVVA